jgi:type I restriction enzyme S subunit
LRFPEFSGEWKCTTIGNIGDIKNGPFGSVLHAEDYVKNGIPIVTTEHFKTGLMPSDKFGIPQVSNEDYIRLKGYRLETNDIVFSRVGSVDINAHVGIEQNGWLFSGRVLRVRPKYDIDSLFLHYALSTEAVKRDIRNRAVGQTMPSINTPILSSTTIQLPKDLFEQKKVAHFLRLLDKRIITQNKIIEKYESLIQAIIYQKKAAGIRKGDWQKTELSNVLKERIEKNTNGYIICSVSVSQGVINQIEYLGRSFAAKETLHYNVVKYGDIVYTKSPTGDFPYGIVKRSYIKDDVAVSPLYGVYMPVNDYIGVILHFYFMQPSNAFNYLHPLIQKGAKNTINITNERFLKNSIPLPKTENEAIYIANTLISIQKKIDMEKKMLWSYEKEKQYLLSKMFI